jgi:hypothetical protein
MSAVRAGIVRELDVVVQVRSDRSTDTSRCAVLVERLGRSIANTGRDTGFCGSPAFNAQICRLLERRDLAAVWPPNSMMSGSFHGSIASASSSQRVARPL